MAPDRRDGSPPPDPEAAREAVRWIVGRLNVLEFLILLFALALALGGGALVAWVLGSALNLSFRWTWAVCSLFLFILPGGFVYLRESRARGPDPEAKHPNESKEPNG